MSILGKKKGPSFNRPVIFLEQVFNRFLNVLCLWHPFCGCLNFREKRWNYWMIELRKALHPRLRAIHPRAYFQRAPDTAQFPYITYSFEMIPDGEGFELVVLDIDGWDMPDNSDTTRLENLMSDVNRVMNKTTLTTDDLVVSFYLDRKLALEDDNPKIIRRKYVYQGRLFERRDR